MSVVDNITAFFADDERLAELDTEQSKAFLDLLILAVFSDGRISEEEIVGLDAELARLPFANDELLQQEVGDHGVATKERLIATANDDEAIGRFLDDVAQRIGDDTELRKKALAMAYAIAIADGLQRDEARVCLQLGRAFGFEQQEIAGVMNTVAEALDSRSSQEPDSEDL